MDVEPERILRLVKKPRAARDLLRHPRHQSIKFSGDCFYWRDARANFTRLRGLTKCIRDCCWPHSDTRRMLAQVKRAPGDAAPGGRFGGLIKGTGAHEQMQSFVELDRRAFLKKHRAMDSYTQRLLRAVVQQLRLQPFLSELAIGCERLGIGTAVDMLALDAQGRINVLEFKTGYRAYWDVADGVMRGSLPLRNTPQNQATVQVLAAAAILQARYDVPWAAMRCCVVRVDAHETEVLPLPQAFVERAGPLLYADLLRAAQARPKKQKRGR